MFIEPVTIQRLADRLKRREIHRFVYFHCDHFEPWSHLEGIRPNDARHVEDVIQFAEDCSTVEFAKRLTLFYQPFQSFTLDVKRELIRAYPADALGFVPRTIQEIEHGRHAMQGLLDRVGHEIQLHMHHEGFTSNTNHRHDDFKSYLATPEGYGGDGARFTCALDLYIRAIRDDTGLPFDEWFFVHGLWALQGSDSRVCNIADELQRLVDAGCKGDFTFPAGRSQVNSHYEVPYFCYPINEIRGYDLDAGEPERAYGNPDAALRKFFVWSSKIQHTRSSLDYYDTKRFNSLMDPLAWASDIIDLSYSEGGVIYFKTHAHSMAPPYRPPGGRLLPPHLHPKVRDLFGVLIEATDLADTKIDFLTASEVYNELVNAKPVPPAERPLFDASRLPAGPDDPVLTFGVPPLPWLAALQASLKARPQSDGDQSPPLHALAAKIDATAIGVMQDRITLMGEIDSGAYRYYAHAVEQKSILNATSISLVEAIVELGSFNEYHEVGSGLGLVGALIAATGRVTVAIESDARRSAAARAIHDALRESFPALPETLFQLTGQFPEIVEGRDLSQCIAIFANFIGTIDESAVIRGMRRYGYCFVDIDRFGIQISSDTDRADRLLKFANANLFDRGCVLDLPGSQGKYHLLAGR